MPSNFNPANYSSFVIFGVETALTNEAVPVRVLSDGTVVSASVASSGYYISNLLVPAGTTDLGTIVALDNNTVSYGAYYNSGLATYYGVPLKVDAAGVQRQNTEAAAFTNSNITVTNASQSFSAANADRKYLLIQNNDAAGNIYVRFGAASTAATGVKIPPGGNYELNNVCASNSVNIIGDIASNANVVLVEG